MSTQTYRISSLPLPKSNQLLIHNLTPDPRTPNVKEFIEKVLTSSPSLQRRARLTSSDAHYCYTCPLPLPFPYQIVFEPSKEENPSIEDKGATVERWLASREAANGELRPQNDTETHSIAGSLNMHYPKDRDQTRQLIGLSETGLRNCVPHLDVGDALKILGDPLLTARQENDEEDPKNGTEEEVAAREQMVDVLSGYAVLMSRDEGGFAPWSLRYSGHQFGTWAGQLGDGRAISVLVTPHPENSGLTYELQLKGAGRTPFSRSADGLAVLRSSIREFLCAEAMHALSIPTTRSLSLVHLPDLPVEREQTETACILTRMAPSFLRIGSFEALNPPAELFFFGGGQQPANLEALRILGEWVAHWVLNVGGEGVDAWGKKLVLEVASRNAKMVAGWQAYGFMHGVINTDNVSIMGLTIDYGPYAFMDVFDLFHICNHSDSEGRYAYMYQPNMIVYALRSLLKALSPVIGAEIELGDKPVSPEWAEDASETKIREWSEAGMDAVKDEMESLIQKTTAEEYGRLMRKRLGLLRQHSSDETRLTKPLLDMMKDHRLDFHSTFRKLAYFEPGMVISGNDVKLGAFIEQVLTLSPEQDRMDRDRAIKDWKTWLTTYAERIEGERDEWKGETDLNVQRHLAMKEANPRFVLRQWVLEEVIKKVEDDPDVGKRILGKVLKMASNPFESWGAEGRPEGEVLSEEVTEERRYCGLGEKKMLGFQCSCSS